jgi:hypothetical protein
MTGVSHGCGRGDVSWINITVGGASVSIACLMCPASQFRRCDEAGCDIDARAAISGENTLSVGTEFERDLCFNRESRLQPGERPLAAE